MRVPFIYVLVFEVRHANGQSKMAMERYEWRSFLGSPVEMCAVGKRTSIHTTLTR